MVLTQGKGWLGKTHTSSRWPSTAYVPVRCHLRLLAGLE